MGKHLQAPTRVRGPKCGARAVTITPSLELRLQEEPLSAKMTNNFGLSIDQPNLKMHPCCAESHAQGQAPQALL